MPLVAAAVCPHPPVIVPEIAAGAAAELDELRAACDAAVARLVAADPDLIMVLGAADRPQRFGADHGGTFAPWGVPLAVRPVGPPPVPDAPVPDAPVPVSVPVPAPPPAPDGLPLSLLIGAWLLARHPARAHLLEAVARDAPAPANVARGADLAAGKPRLALLVMGDGSACRGTQAPGYLDPGAEPYDDGVAAALDAADTDALIALDPTPAARLRVTGRAPWQVLAGAVAGSGRPWQGRLHHHSAPYGVGYFVATWNPR